MSQPAPIESGPARQSGTGKIWKWTKRILLSLLVLIVLLASAGLLYQEIATRREGKRYPPAGKRVEIGGYRLHLNCIGEGSPTVVFDSALGGTWMDWALVQPEVAKLTRACTYDRAGLGWSDPSPLPRTSHNIAQELEILLTRAGEQSPFVLVGHSVAGYHVRVFASRFRQKTAGLVLVESAHEKQDERLPAQIRANQEAFARMVRLLKWAMYFGVPRLAGLCGGAPESLPQLAGASTANQCRVAFFRTVGDELAAVQEDAKEAARTGSLQGLPLIVISRDPSLPEAELSPEDATKALDAWQEMQKDLARLSDKGQQIVAPKSGHYVPLDRPDVVIQATLGVVRQVRSGK